VLGSLILRGRRRGGKLRSFFSKAIAPKTFLRKAPLSFTVSGSAWWCEFLTVRGTPYNLNVPVGLSRRIYDVTRVAQNRRDLDLPAADRIEQPLLNFRQLSPSDSYLVIKLRWLLSLSPVLDTQHTFYVC